MIAEVFSFLNQINWIISLVGAIILSIVGNLLTPFIKNILDKKSEQKMNERIKNLEQEKEEIKNYAENPILLISFVSESLLIMFIYFAVANAVGVFGYFSYLRGFQLISALLYYDVAMKAYKTLVVCRKVKSIDKNITRINEEIKTAETRLSNLND